MKSHLLDTIQRNNSTFLLQFILILVHVTTELILVHMYTYSFLISGNKYCSRKMQRNCNWYWIEHRNR